jgi:molecular chaperone DnaK
MARNYIDYGIDLGTTNSAICRINDGTPEIIKSDRFNKDTTPSCVSINKKQSLDVGDLALSAYGVSGARKLANPNALVDDAYIEFKRTMGTNKRYNSVHLQREFSSVELSAEVLKKLKSYVRDDNVRCAVITVPAKFKNAQIDATQKAAELAGFEYCELLQEPVAASIAYGINAEDIEGKWLVFDFGGGTFDAAVLSAEERVMKVVDTEGDNFLGGKNLDYAIVDHLLIPSLERQNSRKFYPIMSDEKRREQLRTALKLQAEDAKIALSTGGSVKIYQEDLLGPDSDVELDIELSLAEMETVIKPIFQKAIDLTKKLLRRNRLDRGGLTQIVLVGGPTQMQTLRQMLLDQLGVKIETSVDPMIAVARGAAIQASTIKVPEELVERDLAKVQLKVDAPDSTVEDAEMVAIAVQRHLSDGSLPQELFVEVGNRNGAWASGRFPFDGDKILLPEVPLESGINQFEIGVFDSSGTRYPCEPQDFGILQGITVAKQTLTHAVGMAVVNSSNDRTEVRFLQGLHRNQTLPAVGRGRFKTMKDLHPGDGEDGIDIELFDGEDGDDKGVSPQNCTFFASNQLTGNATGVHVPAGSEVDIIIKLDSSRRATGMAFFPHADLTIEFPFHIPEDTTPKPQEIKQAIRKKVNELRDSGGEDSENDPKRDELIERLEHEENQLEIAGSEEDQLLQSQENVRGVMKDVDRYEADQSWLEVKKKLDFEMADLRKVAKPIKDAEVTSLLQEVEAQYQQVVAREDIKLAKKLTDDVVSLYIQIEKKNPEFWINMIGFCFVEFDEIQWTNVNAAKQALEVAETIIMENGGVENYNGSLEDIQAVYHNIHQYRIFDDAESSGADVNRLGTVD